MKLLEFFARLDELQKRLYFRDQGNAAAIQGSRRGFPSVVLLSADGRKLSETDHIYAINIQPRKILKLYDELSKIVYGSDMNGPIADARDTVNIIDRLSSLDLDPRMIHKLEQLPLVITELKGLPRIFKFITTDLRLNVAVYKRFFGDLPEDVGEDEFTPFHNARLFLPDNMSARSRDNATTVLEQVYRYLDKIGETDVFRGDIRFIPLTSNVGGLYDVNHHDIKVNPNIKKSGNNVYTLLHEYGHKKMFEDMTPEAVQAIKDKYRELRREGEGHLDDIDYASAMMDAYERLQPGTKLTYVGRKKDWNRNRDYVVSRKGNRDGKLRVWVAYAHDPKFVRGSWGIQGILNPKQWRIEDADIESPKRKAKHEIVSDQWFPTQYSETEPDEWWAELYAFYALGNLRGEPAGWMKSMLSGNTTEMVGSNDGEMNSEDDVPWPGPAHGDEEGNASWDWTDPYHSSGEENAVTSNRP